MEKVTTGVDDLEVKNPIKTPKKRKVKEKWVVLKAKNSEVFKIKIIYLTNSVIYISIVRQTS